MSSLWSQKQVTIITSKQKPSPNHTYSFRRYALIADLKLHNEFHKIITYGYDFIKKISLRIFSRQEKGSMTVEASIVLPLFLFFFLNLMSAMEMIRVHGNLQAALTDTGNQLTMIGYCVDAAEEIDWQELPLSNIVLTYSFIKGDIIKNAGRKYLDRSPIVYGADGLQFLGSHLYGEEEQVEICMTYAVTAPISMLFVKPILLHNYYYGHAWTGYRILGTDEGAADTKYYYVTEYGEVYHATKECSYLKISKRKVSLLKAKTEINSSGAHYTPCSKCKRNMLAKEVWITDSGDHYHYWEDCPGLTRKIYMISEREISGYRACNRCVSSK